MSVIIDTERLVLRDWTDGDGEEFARATNTPAVMRWLGGVLPPDRMAAAVERYSRWQRELGHSFWVVERREDRALLGFCGLKLADSPGNPLAGALEIGWRLREDAWGRGYAGEAAAGSLDFACGTLGADRIIAVTVRGNRASWTLMRRLGMRHLPELDYEDTRFEAELNPSIIYAITRGEWEARRG